MPPDASGAPSLWAAFLAEHEAAFDRAIAEDEQRARRRHIGDAILHLMRATDYCERRGMVANDYLQHAAAALRQAGMPEHAAIASAASERIGGDDSDLRRLIVDLELVEKGLPR